MSHAAKQRALEAYAQELLSVEGTMRVERHLAECGLCRETLGQIRAYEALCRDVAEQEVPVLTWERMSSALDQQEKAPSGPLASANQQHSGRVIALIWPVLAIAATVLIGWIGMSSAPSRDGPVASRVPSSQPVAMPPAAAVTGRVTLLAGVAYVQNAKGERTPVTLGSEVSSHDLLVTEPASQLHVAWEDSTGFVLGESSQLAVVQLSRGQTRLDLQSGVVSSRVKKLAPGERYEVSSQELVASVRGTRFTVERRQSYRVFVHEGVVAVARNGEQLALLEPGQQFQAPKPVTESAAPADLSPHALSVALAELRPVLLPAVRDLGAWQIDDAWLPANGPLAMRAPPGPMKLAYRDQRGQVRLLELRVEEQGLTVEPAALSKLLAPREVAAGHLEAEQIRRVIAGAFDPLRRCYERTLKVTPGLEGKLRLAMRVAPDGHVVRTEAIGGDGKVPAELARCIAHEAGRLQFPKPEGGGPVSFEVPLNLRAGH